jgi:hypothetical protein
MIVKAPLSEIKCFFFVAVPTLNDVPLLIGFENCC